MSLIIQNEEFKIYKDKTMSRYTIEFEQKSISLINSIVKNKIIAGITIDEYNRSFIFKAYKVQTLTKYKTELELKTGTPNMDYTTTQRLCYYLTKQIKYLILNEKVCFFVFDPNKIIVIDDSKFIFLSNDNLMNIENTNIIINAPFEKTKFIAPELLLQYEIPTIINYKIVYYSLGLIIIYGLFSIDEEVSENKDSILKPIFGTSLYNLLIGCLNENNEKRTIIYI
jgi:hypothetical protein